MPLRIVYVDDEIGLCQMFVDGFASADVDVRTFVNPLEAIKEINATVPDLVLLDFRLPGMTGDEMARSLNPSIDRVLLTGDLSVKAAEKFVKVFHKPFDFAEMEAFLQSYSKEKLRGSN